VKRRKNKRKRSEAMIENAQESGNSHEKQKTPKQKTPKQKTPDAQRKFYASWRYPFLKIANRVVFENGFFFTEDADIQALIERNDAFGIYIKDVSDAVNLKRRAQPEQAVYVSLRDPALTIGLVTFRDGVFSTDDFNLQNVIKLSAGYLTEVRDVSDVLTLEAALDKAEKSKAEAPAAA
jgi:hypothetical protein